MYCLSILSHLFRVDSKKDRAFAFVSEVDKRAITARVRSTFAMVNCV